MLWLWLGCAEPEPVATAPPQDTGVPSVDSQPLPLAPFDLVMEPVSGRSDALDLWIVGDPVATADVRCEGAGEVHRLPDMARAPDPVRLPLLLADTDWTCTATADLGVVETTARTGSLPADLPPWTVTGATEHYTLFNLWEVGQPTSTMRVVLVDPLGRVRWLQDGASGGLADLDVSFVPPDQLLVSGASAFPPVLQDWDGVELARAAGPVDAEGWYHHDADWLPSDEILALTTVPLTGPGGSFWGFGLERLHGTSGAIQWSWSSQSALDAGVLVAPTDAGLDDPWHANAVALEGEVLWVSLAATNRILRVDTVTGQLTGALGRGGDWLLQDAMGTALPDSAWFSGQHDPEPTGDRLLIHDNGTGASPRQSRVVELVLDDDGGTATVGWEWTEPGWYEPLFGDADRLGEDAVRVTMGHCVGCDPNVDPERRSAIVEVERATGAVRWRLQLPNSRDGVYRSEAVAACEVSPTLDGC